MANDSYSVLGSNASVASASGVAALAKRGLVEKSRNYKFWVLAAALLLLAFWSMLIRSVTLRRSIGTLATGDSPDSASYEDLDILEIEKREKVVRHMWAVYTHSKTIRLPRFWQDAFRAGYESLASDAPGVRDAAVTEIAKMSLRSTVSDPFAVQDTSNGNPAVKHRNCFRAMAARLLNAHGEFRYLGNSHADLHYTII